MPPWRPLLPFLLLVDAICFARMLDVVPIVNEGIDEMDVHLDTTTPLSNAAAANAVASTFGQNGLLASIVPKPDKPCDDYDADWFCAAHPSSFPHNTGRCPKGTSLDFYCKTLLNRYPISQFAQTLPLIADSLNILQRHAVNTHAWVQFRCSPDKCNALANTQLTGCASRSISRSSWVVLSYPWGLWPIHSHPDEQDRPKTSARCLARREMWL